MNTVINPITGNRHNIHSKIGRALLKSYILSYKAGGMNYYFPPPPPSSPSETSGSSGRYIPRDLSVYIDECEADKEELGYLNWYIDKLHYNINELKRENKYLNNQVYGIQPLGTEIYWDDEDE